MKKEVSDIDSFASKGILLAKIKKNDMIFNVINTHYQAWVKNYKQRVLASLAMKNFIKENITNLKEPVIICGDLNEDRIHLPKRVSLLYKIMDVIEPKRAPNTPKFTYNRKKNEFVGLDGSKYTFSQAIDYILYSKLHKQPINANYKIIQLQSDKKYLANIKRHDKHILFTKQLSDHYPVLGTFTF
jgi:endonuclease/exonuclease/phosphatase family metal-dependent hydrolase